MRWPSHLGAVAGAAVGLIAWGTLLVVLMRFGVLAVVFLIGVSSMLDLTTAAPFGAWYAYATWIPLVTVAAIAIFAFYTSLAGRPVFREALLET